MHKHSCRRGRQHPADKMKTVMRCLWSMFCFFMGRTYEQSPCLPRPWWWAIKLRGDCQWFWDFFAKVTCGLKERSLKCKAGKKTIFFIKGRWSCHLAHLESSHRRCICPVLWYMHLHTFLSLGLSLQLPWTRTLWQFKAGSLSSRLAYSSWPIPTHLQALSSRLN